MADKKCLDCKFWMVKEGFCCILEKIRKYCLRNNLLYWDKDYEERQPDATGRVEAN